MQYSHAERPQKSNYQPEKPLPVNHQNPQAVTSPYNLIQRAKQDPHNLTTSEILRLQQTIGNRAVTDLLVPHKTSSNLTKLPSQVQRKYEATTDPDTAFAHLNIYDRQNFNWKYKADAIYKHIDELKKVLEDDSDVKDLEEWEKGIDVVVKSADDLTKEYNDAPAYADGLQTRSKTKTRSEDGTLGFARKRKQTEVEGEDGEVSAKKSRKETKDEIAGKIRQTNIQLGVALSQLKATFPLSEGGFSAKGRAHDMEEKEAPETGHSEVTTWFNGIVLDGTVLNKLKKVYKKNQKKSDPAGDPALYFYEDVESVEEMITDLTPTHGPFSFERPPSPKDRGAGQLAAMGFVNATGYAKLAGVPNWKDSRWEWLHIRAASLGGTTDGSNLVAGTRDANTHMMPFEANIRLLAKLVNEDTQKRYKALQVTFKASGQHPKAKHRVDEISISWKLIKSSTAPTSVKEASGEAKFKPLQTDVSISKTEVALLEKTLKEKREELSS